MRLRKIALFHHHGSLWPVGLGLFLFVGACTRQGGMLTYDNAEKQEVKSEDEDQEAEQISEPVMVGGTFLHCVADPSLQKETGKVGTGCAIMAKTDDGSTKRVALNRGNIKASLALYSPLNEELTTSATDAPAEDETYHWYIQAPETQVTGSNVAAALTYIPTNTTKTQVATVDAKNVTAIPEAINMYIDTIGGKGDYFIGKPGKGANGCPSDQDRLAEGTYVQIPFEVKSDNTSVGIIIKDICSVISSKHLAIVTDGTNQITSKNFDQGTVLMLDGFTAKKGLYYLKLKLQDASIDYFGVGSIEFRSTSPLTFYSALSPSDPVPTPSSDTSGNPDTTSLDVDTDTKTTEVSQAADVPSL